MENTSNRLRIRLILFPAPLVSHLNSMIRLAYILHSKGFSITIIHTHFNSPNKLAHPNFKYHPINDGLSKEDEAATTTPDFNRSIELMVQLNQSCVKPFRNELAKLVAEEGKKEPVACLITDYIWPFTETVADAYKIPRIVFRTDSRFAFPSTKDQQPIMPEINAENKETFINYNTSMRNSLKSASGVIWNSFKELEKPQIGAITGRSPPTDLDFLIGPMSKYEIPILSSSTTDRTCISWLDSQLPNSVVYVSFGGTSALDESEFVEMAWGLANSKRPFLWVVRPGSIRGSEWVEKLPDEFMDIVGKMDHMIIKWAPQLEVLAHPAIGCFWTHCGWNSVVECLSEGVPMICSPSFGDHFVAAKFINDHWKVGVKLENRMERKEIEKAIKKLMEEKEGEEIKERAMYFKEKADGYVKEGGSSFMELERLVNYIVSFK